MTVDYQTQVVALTDDDLKNWTVVGSPTPPDRPTQFDFTIHGKCPIAGCIYPYDPPTISTSVNYVEGLTDDNNTRVGPLPVSGNCACGEEHTGRPEGKTGCGAEWLVEITSQDGTFTVKQGDFSLLSAARAFNEATKDQLENIRKSADNWVKAVGTLLGLFSLAGLVFAKDAIANLASPSQVAFGGLAALALATAAAGTYLANKAAYGWPRRASVMNDAQLRAFFYHYQDRARKSADNLRYGVWLTLVSVAALLAALMVLWFGPAATPPEPLVKLTSSDGSISCGSLLKSGADKKVHIRTADGKVVTINPASIRELTIVKEC